MNFLERIQDDLQLNELEDLKGRKEFYQDKDYLVYAGFSYFKEFFNNDDPTEFLEKLKTNLKLSELMFDDDVYGAAWYVDIFDAAEYANEGDFGLVVQAKISKDDMVADFGFLFDEGRLEEPESLHRGDYSYRKILHAAKSPEIQLTRVYFGMQEYSPNEIDLVKEKLK